jgi:hypothetical protein
VCFFLANCLTCSLVVAFRYFFWLNRCRELLDVLPHESVLMQFLDAPELCQVNTVCRRWRQESNKDVYWLRLYNQRYPEASLMQNAVQMSFKLKYKENVLASRKVRLWEMVGLL